jgi:hypothetical protein
VFIGLVSIDVRNAQDEDCAHTGGECSHAAQNGGQWAGWTTIFNDSVAPPPDWQLLRAREASKRVAMGGFWIEGPMHVQEDRLDGLADDSNHHTPGSVGGGVRGQ